MKKRWIAIAMLAVLLMGIGGAIGKVGVRQFSGGSAYAGDTGTYLRVLAAANRALAERADAVCEVACGLPRYYKGEGAAL